jgi:hypothetical protein
MILSVALDPQEIGGLRAPVWGKMTFSVLDRRPATSSTASDLPSEQAHLMGGCVSATPPGWVFWLAGALVAGLTLAVFLPSVWTGWVNWDDADNFLGNPSFRGLAWSNLRWILAGSVQDAHWIPLTSLTLSIDYVLWDMNLAGYHLTSVIIHSVNAFLCYEQYGQTRQALEQYRLASTLLPDDVTACQRARRLASKVSAGERVLCGAGARS